MHPMVTAVVGLIFVGTLAASAGELAEMHAADGSSNKERGEKGREEAGANNHGVTEIGIERTMCFGTCPVYTFIAKSDGTFRYKGEDFVDRKGDFAGRIPMREFNRLAHFIRSAGYMRMQDRYSRLVTDLPTTYTTVVMNGKRKTIRHYAKAGPKELAEIEKRIDRLMALAQWPGKRARR